MRRRTRIAAVLLTLGIVLGVDRAGAGFFDFLRSDLKFKVLVESTEGLTVDDAVLYEDSQGEMITIGRITAIPDDGGGYPLVEVAVDAKHKDLVRAGSPVMLDRPWLPGKSPRIVIATPADQADSAPLRTGAVVLARSKQAEKTDQAVDRLRALMGNLVDQSREHIDRLRRELDSDKVDRFLEQLDTAARAVGRFSAEQKRKFEKEVLPELEKMMDKLRRRLKALKDSKKRDELERRFKHLKEQIAV